MPERDSHAKDPLKAAQDSTTRLADLQVQIERIMDITTGIIYMLDPDGCFTFLNRGVETILNYSPQELIGKHFSTIMSIEEYRHVGREHLLPSLKGVVTGGSQAPKLFDERRTGDRRTRNLEVRLLTKKRNDVKVLTGDVTGIISVEGAYDPKRMNLGDSAAAFIGSQGIIFDITRYKRYEEEQRALLNHAYERQKIDAIAKLAGGIAKDFSEKLTSIIGFADIISRKYGSSIPELSGYLTPVIAASRRMADLTEKLMAFGQQNEYRFVPIDIHAALRDAIDLLETVIERNVAVRKSLCSQNPLMYGDPAQIRNLILNMVFNALEAMPNGGDLSFETAVEEVSADYARHHTLHSPGGSYIRISIADTGRGMDRQTTSRIFEPFFSTKGVAGVGMGLASAYGCIKSHHGFINVESEVEKGSRFNLFLPLLGMADDTVGTIVQSRDVLDKRDTILVVDSDEYIRASAREILSSQGFVVATVSSGSKALDFAHAQSGRIGLAIIAMTMPDMNGHTCFKEMTALVPGLKAYLSTGYDIDARTVQLPEGIKGFLHKPFTMIGLVEAVSASIPSADQC